MNKDCTIVVSSCDSYEDTWYPFFKILKANWENIPYPIVLNTETKSFDFEDLNIKTFQMYKDNPKVEWGKRLIDTLERIDTEYILFMLDDFFLLDKVDENRIFDCINWMDEDTNISVFSFGEMDYVNIKDNKYLEFEKRPQVAPYRFNCQAALWRRKNLISYIRPHENPWEWELLGSQRSQRYTESFYTMSKNGSRIFNYDFKNCGIVRGKWTKSVVDLFDKHDIEMDFSKRGFKVDTKRERTKFELFMHNFRFVYLNYFKLKKLLNVKNLYHKYLSLKK